MSDIYHMIALRGGGPVSVIPVAAPTALVLTAGEPAGQPWPRFVPTPPLCVLQPIQRKDRGLSLLLARRRIERMVLNGDPVPLLAELQERDELVFPRHDLVVHVTLFRGASVLSASPAVAGRKCVLCRTPVVAEAPVYQCVCGAVLCGPADTTDATGCAALTPDCPRCNRPVNLTTEGGYTWWPEGVE
ncbi:MAG: hypothetical protein KJ726_10455 [Verrucomicrobia bacterium]|nr:hypothetical protein [Verrucomicrobiota bacterium]